MMDAIGMRLAIHCSRARARARGLVDDPGAPKHLTLSAIKASLRQGIAPNQDHRYSNARIYFAADDIRGLVKIGISNDVPRRLAGIAREMGGTLRLIGTIPGRRAVESEMHRLHAFHRAQGEWFHAHPDLLESIDRVLAERGDEQTRQEATQ